MKSQAIVASALTLMLAACASEPPPTPASAAAPPAAKEEAKAEAESGSIQPWMGLWSVAEQFGSAQPTAAMPPLGQKLHLEEYGATDMAGRTCPQPTYRAESQSEAAFLGLATSDAEALRQARPSLSVTCGKDAFGSYLMARDGSLLTVTDGQVLHLVRATVPEMKPEAKADARTAEDAKHDEKKTDEAKPGKAGALVYLASYRDKGTAMEGWKELGKASPLLAHAQPELSKITLPGKGTYLRLKAKGLSETDGKALCKSLVKMLPDCGAKGRD
ncbi:MAG TPA: hypothetical protein VM661_06045 [Candidatus Sulfotelmatobacter sp.]|jgi:hypothetical protein|nr:hypothetical protein [Candidatus Sulfotelmatobacter sp.]